MRSSSQASAAAAIVAFAHLAAAAPAAVEAGAVVPTVHMPVHMRYGQNNKFATSLVLPYSDQSIEVCYDLGSPDFFLFSPNATQNWGCRYLACQGPCNATVPEEGTYDPSLSKTATAPRPWAHDYGYGGGLNKWYRANKIVNDTFAFTNHLNKVLSQVSDVEVALVPYLQQRTFSAAENSCAEKPAYDYSILGMAPYFSSPDPNAMNTTGPSFRQNLLDQGRISAPVQSLWMERRPDDVRGTFTGAGLLGGIDTSKYSGPLVRIPRLNGVGYSLNEYYTHAAKLSFNGVAPIPIDTTSPDVETECILDSGGIGDAHNPVDVEAYYNVTGLRLNPSHPTPYQGNYLSWPGKCEDIPADHFMEYSLVGVREGETAVVKVPMRNYARFQDPIDEARGWCTMAISLKGCSLNAPFLSAAFFAADDESGEIAIAQGGVAEQGSGVDNSKVVLRIP
ncbi:hypothetical protein RB594_003443 [Gaeumannomyces avenae]